MANYKVQFSVSAEKSLKKLPKKEVLKIVEVIQTLVINPFPLGCRKLVGEEKVYRIRQGNYRIIYEVESKILNILVLKIGHRKEVYR